MDIKMENCNVQERESNPIIENKVESNDTTDDMDVQSADKFQKFIYDLFEKNGILNDLRAYLRGHIVNILKSAQTGDPPACQKHFTQRLELTFQALNILIVEYLLRLDFNYTLSVFVSELPLANMVFRFAKSLMNSDDGVYSGLRFQDSDVWSILNYLGVKCDSEHAANIVDMYRSDNISPLLVCILKCIPMYSRQCGEVSSNESASTSDTLDGKAKSSHRRTMHDKCKHYQLCKSCQHRVMRIKEKYRRKKKNLTKPMTETCENSINVEDLMKNIGVMERSLIDEMFQQLKSVYEIEMEMVREEDDKRVKRSLASHALQLQRRSEQMEASFKDREAQLELSVQQKKRFLWGLARALREQHRNMAAAMHQVRRETHRLELKENSLKSQLAEAEQILKQRGEDMRAQVSNELTILESHIDSMKRERDSINRERSQLENLKSESTSHVAKIEEDEGLRSHYELLRNELSILKKYVESVKLQPKCVMERSTITDYDVTVGMVLNNAQEEKERGVKSDRVKANQLVNDLKKQKNVNFSQSNLEEINRDSSRERSRSSASSEAGDANAEPTERDTLIRLQQENENLKKLALQQRQQIEELSSHQASLRPLTAPAVMPLPHYFLHRVNPSASANTLSVGWRKGAGEEISLFSHAQPRVVVPGDTLPFIGVLRDRHPDPRRHLISQWRALRRRTSPLRARPRPEPMLIDRNLDRPDSAGATLGYTFEPRPGSSSDPPQQGPDGLQDIREQVQQGPKMAAEENKRRDISPLSILREAKQRLRNKTTVKDTPPAPREKSPSCVLREAKLRLRKLEIEAEAVERSYRHFRRRQTQLRQERTAFGANTTANDIVKELDGTRSKVMQKLSETHKEELTNYMPETSALNNDAERYLREYQTKYDIGETHFRNKTATAQCVKPIPAGFSIIEGKETDFLDTPLDEFRKFYTSDNRFEPDRPHSTNSIKAMSSTSSGHAIFADRKPSKAKDEREQMEILKQNIGKIYNLPDEAALEELKIAPELEKKPNNEVIESDKNLLRVEVESVNKVNNVQISESRTQDLLLVISSGDTRDKAGSDPDMDEKKPEMTIIISPKHTSPKTEGDKSPRMKSESDQGPNDVIADIFNSDANNQISSVNLDIELSKDLLEESLSDVPKGADEYPDDFSADVDNYNSRSEYENNSPISLVKTSEDENFWDN